MPCRPYRRLIAQDLSGIHTNLGGLRILFSVDSAAGKALLEEIGPNSPRICQSIS